MERKPCLVKWDVACIVTRRGGLRVKRLDILNRAPLGKWSWHFMEEMEDLWHSVISSKYAEEGAW